MAENFFTGLTGAIQQNAKQRNNDDYIDLMRQKQLQSEMSGALADKRADEEMVMRREAAGRQQEESARRIRALDFEQRQKEDAAERLNRFRTESSNYATKFWAPEAVLDAAGNPAMDKDGKPITTKRDPKNYRDQFKFYEGLAAIGHQHNGIDPKSYGQFLMDRTALEDRGKTQVFENALRQDKDALAEVGAAVGLSGNVRVGSRVDRFGLPSMFFSGVGKDGKPAEVDALAAMGIFGGNAKDPTAGSRAQAVQTQNLKVSQQNADSNSVSARAAMVRAERPPSGGRGGGGDVEEDQTKPLSGKALRQEVGGYVDDVRADKIAPSTSFGRVGLMAGDAGDVFARDKISEIGSKLFTEGVQTTDDNGKKIRIYPKTRGEARSMANNIYYGVESRVVSETHFLPDGKGKYSQVSPGTKGALPFSDPRVPYPLKVAARDAGVSSRLSPKSAANER